MYNEALIEVDKAILFDENNSTAFDSRAEIKFYLEDYNGSIVDAKKAVNLNSKMSNSYLILGRSYFRLGKKDLACESWSKALDLGNVDVRDYMTKYCK